MAASDGEGEPVLVVEDFLDEGVAAESGEGGGGEGSSVEVFGRAGGWVGGVVVEGVVVDDDGDEGEGEAVGGSVGAAEALDEGFGSEVVVVAEDSGVGGGGGGGGVFAGLDQ